MKFKNVKDIFHAIDNSMLRCILYFIYMIAEKVVILVISEQKINVWIRNSYYLNSLVVGISDLDISVQYMNRPSEVEINKLKTKLRYLKYFFPFLGETNIYVKSDEELLRSFNFYEMKRDPYLSTLTEDDKGRCKYQKLIFILRMLESDRENLCNFPQYRQKKWKSHFKSIDGPFYQKIGPVEVLDYIASSMPGDSERYREVLNSFLKSGEYHFSDSREMALLFPHRWSVWVNINGGIEEGIKKLNLSDDERIIFQEMIRWEIMGLYTQRFLLTEKDNINFYLNYLREVNMLISSYDQSVLDRSLSKLIQEQSI